MAIQSPERAAEVINFWFSRHKELVNDTHNAEVLGAWIKVNHGVGGELIFTDASLEMAFQASASSGELHFYASQDTQKQIAQANRQALEAQTKLAEEQAEKNRQANILRRELERDARQDARRPGPSSAFANQDDVASQKERARKSAEAAIQRQQCYAKFRERLSEANIYWEPNHAAKNDRKKQLFDAIRRDFPEFATELSS